MQSAPTASERLITLSANGEREKLLLELQQPATIQTILSEEEIAYGLDSNFRCMQLNLIPVLQAAAGAGHADVVELLLGFGRQHNVDLLLLTKECLSSAMRVNPLEVLLKFHAFVPETFSLRLRKGGTILDVACRRGERFEPAPGWKSLSLMRYLMQNGFDPNWRYYGTTFPILHWAAMSASCAIVECLLEHGASIRGSDAPRVAVKRGRIDILEILLRHGADLNECFPKSDFCGPSGTLLHVAVASNQTNIVKRLLQRRADTSICNSEGKTASDLLSEDSDEALQLLLSAR